MKHQLILERRAIRWLGFGQILIFFGAGILGLFCWSLIFLDPWRSGCIGVAGICILVGARRAFDVSEYWDGRFMAEMARLQSEQSRTK